MTSDRGEETPRVSVCLMVYNGDDYIAEAVESILSQTYRDFEFVIVDDGSTDSTPEILRSFAASDPRVRIVRQDNAGVTKARNRSIREARGELIALMDGDDVALPERLAAQVAFLDRHPEVGLLGSAYHAMDEGGTQLWTRRVPTDHEAIRCFLGRNNPIAPSTAMIRRAVLNDVGLQDESIRHCQDHEHWVRVVQKWRAACLPEPLLSRRLHSSSTLAANTRNKLKNVIQVRRMAIASLKLPWHYHLYYLPVWVAARLPRWLVLGAVRTWWRRRARRAAGGDYAPSH